MTRILDEPVAVVSAPSVHTMPVTFWWRGREHRCRELVARWVQRGRWWRGEGERRCFRIITEERLTLDLCQDSTTGAWSVAQVLD